MQETKQTSRRYWLVAAALLVLGCGVRLWQLGSVPLGWNQDEVYSAYEAWASVHYGIDSWGYHNSVYLTVWGSGMSALYSFLTRPFLVLFGAATWVMRLPQALLGCVTLPAFFYTLYRLFNRHTALIGLFVLALNPWHIMTVRWGLDANLAPAFLVFGFLFLALGLKKPGYYLLAAVFYGLSLYCYVITWLFVPLILLVSLLYLFYTGRLRLCPQLAASVVILFCFALPLLLFLAVNKGWINEIVTPFFSIPKLVYYRGGELSFANFRENLSCLLRLLVLQKDAHPWNSGPCGIYYYGSAPFLVLGLVRTVRDTVVSLRQKRFSPAVLFGIQFSAACLLGLLIEDVNVNRLNVLHFPVIFMILYGLDWALGRFNFRPAAAALAAMLFLGQFVWFCRYYFSEDFNGFLREYYGVGIEQALPYAEELSGGTTTVYVAKDYYYPKVLYALQIPPQEFIDTVVWQEESAQFMQPLSFCNIVYKFGDYDPDTMDIIVDESWHSGELEELGYQVQVFQKVLVAWK